MRFAHFESVKQIKITSKSLHDNLEKVIIFGVKNLIDFHSGTSCKTKKPKIFFIVARGMFWGWKSFIASRGRSYKHISPVIVWNFSYCAIWSELSCFFDSIIELSFLEAKLEYLDGNPYVKDNPVFSIKGFVLHQRWNY